MGLCYPQVYAYELYEPAEGRERVLPDQACACAEGCWVSVRAGQTAMG